MVERETDPYNNISEVRNIGNELLLPLESFSNSTHRVVTNLKFRLL